MKRIVSILLVIMILLIVSNATATIPPLRSPVSGNILSRSVSMGFGATWCYGECPVGVCKKHTGLDVEATVGEKVYAAEDGLVKAIVDNTAQGWAYAVTIQHNGFTTVSWHVNAIVAVNQSVVRGQEIATVADLVSNTHFHFGVREASYSNVSNAGALPVSDCGGYPAYPEYFVNPANLTYEQGTTQTAWLFNTNTSEGWSVVGAEAQAFQDGQWWIDPSDDTRILSPWLLRSPSSINYLKIYIRNRGVNSYGKIYLSIDGTAFNETNSRAFDLPNDSVWRFIVIPLNLIPGWGGSNLDRIRIDPVQYGCSPEPCQDNVEIDAILLRMDSEAPVLYNAIVVDPASSSTNNYTFTWSFRDPPYDDGTPTNYGSGLDYYQVKFNDGSWSSPRYPNTTSSGVFYCSWTGTVANIVEGANTFYVRAWDVVGNQSSQYSVNFYYNPTSSNKNLSFEIDDNSDGVADNWEEREDFGGSIQTHRSGGAPSFDGCNAYSGGGSYMARLTNANSDCWSGIGHANVGAWGQLLYADGTWYRISFWYRTSNDINFGFQLAQSNIASTPKDIGAYVFQPIYDGSWHRFISAPFQVSSADLSTYPKFAFYLKYSNTGTVDVDDVRILNSDSCHP